MCTLSYTPENAGFIIGSNRDEFYTRPKAKFPNTLLSKRGKVTFPKDPSAGGTWVAVSDNLIVSILNARYDYNPDLIFKKSRGLVCLEPFQFLSLDEYLEQANFDGIDAFTMVLFERSNVLIERIVSLYWDGNKLTKKEKDPQKPHLWVSIPKEFQSVLDWRESKFQEIHTQTADNLENVSAYHKLSAPLAENGVRILPNKLVFTKSFTLISSRSKDSVDIKYENYE